MTLVDLPFFVPALPHSGGRGVDYLGLRSVNLYLIDEALPGFINATQELRIYSLMSWAVWRYAEAVRHKDVVPSQATQSAWLQKAELLFNWSHQVHDHAVGLPGNQQKRPAGSPVPLNFKSWGRQQSLLDPASYGPTLRTNTGLGFIEGVGGVFLPTDPGSALARALDAVLRKSPAYSALANVTELEATEAQAVDLYEHWHRDNASLAEQQVFTHAFFTQALTGAAYPMQRRSTSVALVLAVLNGSVARSVEEVRCEMAWGAALPASAPHRELLLRMRAHWRVVHVRQAQRLALEALFGFVEDELVFGRAHDSEELATTLSAALDATDLPAARLVVPLPGTDTALNDAGHAMMRAVAMLLDAARGRVGTRTAMLAPAVRMLCDTTVLARALAADPALRGVLTMPGTGDRSLEDVANFVYAHQYTTPAAFLRALIEDLLISQHFRIAVARTQLGKQRLRMALEDTGLASLLTPKEPLRPFLTGDRIGAALALLRHAGVLLATPQGEYRVAERSPP